MKYRIYHIFFILSLICLLIKPIYAKESYNLIYFGLPGCTDCAKVEIILEEFQINNPDARILKLNIDEQTDYELFLTYQAQYNLSNATAPILFFKQGYMMFEDISESNLLTAYQDNELMLLLETNQEIYSNGFSLIKIITLGLLNGLNPCALSFVLFLLSLLIVKDSQPFKIAGPFLLAKFLTYMFLGTTLYSVFSYLDSQVYLKFYNLMNLVIGLFFILFGLLNLWDAAAAKLEKYQLIKAQLPESLRRLNQNMIQRALTHSKCLPFVSFGLGILIAMGEFLCTGQLFTSHVIYIAKTSTAFDLKIILQLTTYTFMMMLPLVFILLIGIKTRQIMYMSEWVRKHLFLIKLINAGVFFYMAYFVICQY